MNPTELETDPGSGVVAPPGDVGMTGKMEQPGGIVSAGARERHQFLLCEHCQAPVDRDQRYCVSCGSRQSHARNPATSYFAAAARSRRTGGSQLRSESALRGPVSALLLILLPVAVAIGVLVGRSGSGAGNDKLIAALQRQPAVAASPVGGVASPAASGTAFGNLASDFSLAHGFAVMLATFPTQGTDQSAVAKAEQEARVKGAAKVGLINPRDFRTTPGHGASSYILFSGEFKTRADAAKALAKLRPRFPGAQVIEVGSVASASAAPVVAHTAYGTVHQTAGSRPTGQQIQQDKKVVQKINRTVGKNYVNAQKNLPDVITVTGGGGGSSGPSESAAEKVGAR